MEVPARDEIAGGDDGLRRLLGIYLSIHPYLSIYTYLSI
jgi:hypothetical protein